MAGVFSACEKDGKAGAEDSLSQPPASQQGDGAALGEASAPLPLAGRNVLTGQPAAEGMLEGQRPIAIMVKNGWRALPQRGLAAGDMLVEMPVEGGDTSLMVFYADYRAISTLGPVGPLEDQFAQFALPLDAVQVHIGASVYAENLLAVSGTKHIDGITLGKISFGFDTQRTLPRPGGNLNENCWFTDGNLILAGMTYLDVYTVSEAKPLFSFASGAAVPASVAASVAVQYSDTAQAGFTLTEGLYYKTHSGNPHVDENGTPLAYTNLVLLSCDIGQKADSTNLEFNFTGGSGWHFTAGGMQPITWQKGSPSDPLKILDSAGNALQVQPGKSYVGFVPTSRENPVTWAPAA